MTTPIVIEITRNGNPLGNRNAGGQEPSGTAPVLRALLAPSTTRGPHARFGSNAPRR